MIVAMAPRAMLSLLEKYAEDAMLGVNEYPSHRRQARGGKICPSEHIQGRAGVPAGSI